MIFRVFAAAIAAGAAAGVLISGIQAVTTTPLILEAESYETAAAPAGPDHAGIGAGMGPEARIVLAHSGEAHDDGGHGEAAGHGEAGGAWGPADGLERTLFTTGTNILAGVGFALLLTGAFALHGRPVDGRRGVIWGLAGFAVFTLAPGLGLPPELPGSMAAELDARQAWWVLAVAATGLGLGLTVFARPGPWQWPMVAAGLAAIALPHVVGAPQPERFGGPVPPELAAHFAAASIATAAVFWALLGWFAGSFYRRLGDAGDASAAS